MFPPSRDLTLLSPLSAAAATAKLKSVVAPMASWQDRIKPSGWVRNGGFMGEVRDDGTFDILRDINYRNSFLPFIKGRIDSDGGGSRITARMAMHKAVVIFTTFWLAFVTLACGGVVYSVIKQAQAPQPEAALLIPFGMLLFGLSLPYLAFTPEANKAEKFLLETLEAQKAPDGQRTAL